MLVRGSATLSAILAFVFCGTADAACDDLVDNLITAKLRPVIDELDCSMVKSLGVDKKDHKLVVFAINRPGRLRR
ncbi:hypothetical protein QA639_28825 [Bradyrhizobium pachyrhizi]|uniref:hypothetical protein n=1 Tax=Bradyrhizobium pachyrhizi TaxID=280333 RepID=UPI0024B1E520|nr:hypothetical protein [Bradyrhizobium pachyrhizi]WFU53645.1 hypothetical protein QA639_28825 [Bradyrhizobium pachyrhizi]